LIANQVKEWETYTWFDKWFASYDQVVNIKLPPNPIKPKFPAPIKYPTGNEIEWINGGAGNPQSGEISIASADKGKSKYFGGLG